jgi:Zn-dependent M28 family amino/carboxypeptidase
MIFLAVTAEEKGLLGSDYFARHPTVPASSIVANVNMDMPVALTPLKDLIAFGAEHSSLGPVAARAAAQENMTLAPDPSPAEVIFVRSDQYCFVRQGVPAIYLDAGTTSRIRGVDGQALFEEFLRTRYHMPGDDTSQPIDYGTLAALGRVNARIGLEVANAPQRPNWNAGDFFGERFARHGAAAAGASSAK